MKYVHFQHVFGNTCPNLLYFLGQLYKYLWVFLDYFPNLPRPSLEARGEITSQNKSMHPTCLLSKKIYLSNNEHNLDPCSFSKLHGVLKTCCKVMTCLFVC